MEIQTHFKILWPILTAIGGFFLACLYTIRYKIPDLTRRVLALEKAGAKSKEVAAAIDAFHTVCKFNQVSCQKQIQAETAKMLKEINSQMAEIYEKLNQLAVSYADVAAKVEIIVKDREKGSGNFQRGK